MSKIKRTVSDKMREANRKRMLGKTRTQETKNKISKGLRRERASNWKCGKFKQNGYVLINNWDSPNHGKNGYSPEHRVIIEKQLGRSLKTSEIIHHLNGERDDNRLENLLYCETHKIHGKIHGDMERFVYKLMKKGFVVWDRENNCMKLVVSDLMKDRMPEGETQQDLQCNSDVCGGCYHKCETKYTTLSEVHKIIDEVLG